MFPFNDIPLDYMKIMAEEVAKNLISSQIMMITTEYKTSELDKFKLSQLESIKYLLLAGFKRSEIEENELYNFDQTAVKLIIQIKLFGKEFNLHNELNNELKKELKKDE